MIYLWATLLTLVNAVWLLTTIVGLPGTWLIALTTALVAWWQWDQQMIGAPVLIALGVLAAVGEAIEFYAGVWGSKRFGGSNRGALGALFGSFVGGLVGTLFAPVLGTLIGACVGAAVGAIVFEMHSGQPWRTSVQSGFGAGVGRLGGTLGKLGAGGVMWLVAAIAAFWP